MHAFGFDRRPPSNYPASPPQANPEGTACITHRGPNDATTTTYAALAQATAGIIRALQQSHEELPVATRPQQQQQQQERHRIALLCRNHELSLAYLFAAADAGWVAAPLNTRWAPPEAAAALADCGQWHGWR